MACKTADVVYLFPEYWQGIAQLFKEDDYFRQLCENYRRLCQELSAVDVDQPQNEDAYCVGLRRLCIIVKDQISRILLDNSANHVTVEQALRAVSKETLA